MQRFNVHPEHPDPRVIRKAADVVRRGGLIAYPTDTVYGIGCDISQKKAIDTIYALKRMSRDQPLAFICPDLGDLARYAIVDDGMYRLMRRLTPGPYCFILTATRQAPKTLHISKKRKSVGIRVPHHEVPLALVRELGTPVVSTTASVDGEVLNDPSDIANRFSGVDFLLDAGYGGLEPSTILDMTSGEVEVIRQGAGPVDFL